jgi:hypothetical protein
MPQNPTSPNPIALRLPGPPKSARSPRSGRGGVESSGVGVRLMRSIQLGAIAAFTLAVIAFARGESLAATVLFVVAAVGFLYRSGLLVA